MQSTGADRIDSRKLNQCIKSPKSKAEKLFKTSEEGRKFLAKRATALPSEEAFFVDGFVVASLHSPSLTRSSSLTKPSSASSLMVS